MSSTILKGVVHGSRIDLEYVQTLHARDLVGLVVAEHLAPLDRHGRHYVLRRRGERYRRRDFGYMDLEITFDDPKYYTRPFSIKTGLTLVPDSDLLEYVCNENEKDRIHFRK